MELSAIAAASGDPLQKLLEGVGVFYGVGRLKPDANLAAARDEARIEGRGENQVDPRPAVR